MGPTGADLRLPSPERAAALPMVAAMAPRAGAAAGTAKVAGSRAAPTCRAPRSCLCLSPCLNRQLRKPTLGVDPMLREPLGRVPSPSLKQATGWPQRLGLPESPRGVVRLRPDRVEKTPWSAYTSTLVRLPRSTRRSAGPRNRIATDRRGLSGASWLYSMGFWCALRTLARLWGHSGLDSLSTRQPGSNAK